MEAFTTVSQNFILSYKARTLYTISANINYVPHSTHQSFLNTIPWPRNTQMNMDKLQFRYACKPHNYAL
jgi:hypothetical protein